MSGSNVTRSRLSRCGEPHETGAYGEVSGRLFDAAGEPVYADVGDRVIGISAERSRAVPRTITSSFGPECETATRAAVAVGFVHPLVTDDELAR
ncbi:sugar-binding domain-containing protein [Sciscionella marina]|uniref:sugar-binding domain-containing protein n=1 Tax=Sciscionella marina TaxID=508770 RepID=UPI000A037861|nr:sugar-binding domain-containing protein [Sciscionella marina]